MFTTDSPFTHAVNAYMRQFRRGINSPYLPYIRLLLSAFNKISPEENVTLYRGVKTDLRSQYQTGDEVVWWTMTKTTDDKSLLSYDIDDGPQTVLCIDALAAFNISMISVNKLDDERVLLPGTKLRVESITDSGSFGCVFTCLAIFFNPALLLLQRYKN